MPLHLENSFPFTIDPLLLPPPGLLLAGQCLPTWTRLNEYFVGDGDSHQYPGFRNITKGGPHWETTPPEISKLESKLGRGPPTCQRWHQMGGSNSYCVDDERGALDGDQPGKDGLHKAAHSSYTSSSLRAPPAQMVIEKPSTLLSLFLCVNPSHLLSQTERQKKIQRELQSDKKNRNNVSWSFIVKDEWDHKWGFKNKLQHWLPLTLSISDVPTSHKYITTNRISKYIYKVAH